MSHTELLDQFILEARECLETIGQRLLDVEREPDSKELLNDLFRNVHTLKGNCGLFEFKALERVVHAGEDLLDRVRNGTLTYSPGIADALLEAMDYTSELVDLIAQEGHLPESVEARSHSHARALRAQLEQPVAAGPAREAAMVTAAASATVPAPVSALADEPAASTTTAADAAQATELPDWAQRIPAYLRAAGGVALRYRPEPECFFKGEDPWFLARHTPGLQALDVQAREAWAPAEAFDCYWCNLDLVVFSEAPLAYVDEHYRYVPEQVELLEIPAAATLRSTPEAAVAADAADAADASLADSVNTLAGAVTAPEIPALSDKAREVRDRKLAQLWREQVVLLQRSGLAAGTAASIRGVLHRLLLSSAFDDQRDALQAELQALPQGPAPLLQWAQDRAPAGALTAAPNPAAGGTGAASTGASTTSATTGTYGSDTAAVADAGTSAGGGNGASVGDARRSPAGGGEGEHRVLKVAQDKIDRLMDLIGEMVVAKNALPYLAARAEGVFGQRELAREIKAQYSVINRIAEDMQHAIMQVRMLPVGTVFQRFSRLVRDVSKKLGKDVRLVVEGEDTEADKHVIESLADPLIHILRNSMDHGIEMPEVRRAAGKPAQGTLRVSARQEGDRVVLDIADDGAGIDTDRVRAKAIERGLIPEDRASQLTAEEAVQLVFLPGFSTAETISDLSGRGVGMDVVRSAIERINGSVELTSERGKGTLIRLTLPLSMAVTNVMMIEAGGRRFGVPMDLIVETVRVHAEDVHHFKSARTTVLRGRIVALQPLHDLLELQAQPVLNDAQEYAVLVVRMGNETIGLLVDDFHGTSDIILKPLEGVLAGITGFAGTALMGDGSVLMILNPKELV